MLQEEVVIRIERARLPSYEDGHLSSINCLPAALDYGSELIKTVYASASADDGFSFQLHFALFESARLDSALDYLKAKLADSTAAGPEKKLRVTGVGIGIHGSEIKEKLGVELEYVNESASQCRGLRFLIERCPTELFCHAPPAVDQAELADIDRGEMLERLRPSKIAMMSENKTDGPFPCMLLDFGSTASVYTIREDGTWELTYKNELAGRSFLGMSRLLIGSHDYAEIMRLAETGNRGNVDSQVRDILGEGTKSHYGAMPPSMPLLPFGKAADFNKSLEESRREDVAQSLVSSFLANLTYPMSQFARFGLVQNIYLTGNYFRHEFARSEVFRCTKLLGATEGLKMHFPKISNIGALGALLAA